MILIWLGPAYYSASTSYSYTYKVKGYCRTSKAGEEDSALRNELLSLYPVAACDHLPLLLRLLVLPTCTSFPNWRGPLSSNLPSSKLLFLWTWSETIAYSASRSYCLILHLKPISPSTLMKEGLCGRLEADASYTVPLSASSACHQPASVIEASVPRCDWGCKPNLGFMISIQCTSHSQVGKIYQEVWKVRLFSSLLLRVCLTFTALSTIFLLLSDHVEVEALIIGRFGISEFGFAALDGVPFRPLKVTTVP